MSRAQFDRLIVLNGKHLRDPARFNGLHLREWMRFGNSVLQLSNLSQFCAKALVPAVYYQYEHPIFDVANLERTVGVPFIKRERDAFVEADGLILSGNFFFDSPFSLFEGKQRQAVLSRHIAPLVPHEFLSGSDHIDADTLTVHIRSGDIFSDLIHTGYGQPPLAYYRRVLENSQHGTVLVVAEDIGNPVIMPFIELARAAGRKVSMFSGGLRETLAILFNSTELVGGIGSFLWAIEALSPHVRKYWFFERMFDKCVFDRPKIRVARVGDPSGGYVNEVLRDNWRNTPEQRQLMLDYPPEALSIEQW